MVKQQLILAGGCFWCLEAVFELLEGVEDVESGYANGQTENPDYRSVCSGETGHAEVVRITYDDTQISTDDLLEIFFEIHDPTTPNRQGADVGTQYRSAIFYENDTVKEKALRAKESAQSNQSNPIVTIIEPLKSYYPAESYHQDYYRHNSTQGYCMAVISPKVKKLRKQHSEILSK
jgi:peptide-methionine (S)-S-oxide reductase